MRVSGYPSAVPKSRSSKKKKKNDNPKRMRDDISMKISTVYLSYKTSIQILLRHRFESILVSNKH